MAFSPLTVQWFNIWAGSTPSHYPAHHHISKRFDHFFSEGCGSRWSPLEGTAPFSTSNSIKGLLGWYNSLDAEKMKENFELSNFLPSRAGECWIWTLWLGWSEHFAFFFFSFLLFGFWDFWHRGKWERWQRNQNAFFFLCVWVFFVFSVTKQSARAL